MNWLASFSIAVLTAIVATLAGGTVAAACVDWYSISSREGGSGYFIVFVGLLSGIAGFFAGLVISRFVGGPGVAGFFKGLGTSAGGMLGLAAVTALICWLLADIPPTINDHTLNLEVEIRLAKGAADPSTLDASKVQLLLGSISPGSNTWRKSEQGELKIAEAKMVEGRWTIPGSVYIFTTRGTRSLAVVLGDGKNEGFEVPMPAHPTVKYEQWSDWMPRGRPEKPWPDTQMSYRFRVEERLPPPPPPDPAVVAEAKFRALTPEDPLDKWIGFMKYGMAQDREDAILKVVEARPRDLVELLRSDEKGEADRAMYAVTRLKMVDPAVIQAMREIAVEIEEQVKKFAAMKPEQEGYADAGNEVRNRYKSWNVAWWNVHQRSGVDGRPPVEAILKLAEVKPEDGFMQEIILDAKAHLGGLTPATK